MSSQIMAPGVKELTSIGGGQLHFSAAVQSTAETQNDGTMCLIENINIYSVLHIHIERHGLI